MSEVFLQEVMQRIENSFGEEFPFSSEKLSEQELYTLQKVFGDSGFQAYLQDQVNRQIIRDYLLNAYRLGFLDDSQLAAISRGVATAESRSSLALHMLMYSVEQAAELPLRGPERELEALLPTEKSPPHIRIV